MKTKLKSKKWKSLISGVLLAASASSFLIAPVYAADYSKPLIVNRTLCQGHF